MKYHPHMSFPGYGWLEPFSDADMPLIEEEFARDIIAAFNAAVEMIERMDGALESLLIRCDDSDSAMYGTLSTSFVRDTVRIARGEE